MRSIPTLMFVVSNTLRQREKQDPPVDEELQQEQNHDSQIPPSPEIETPPPSP